MEMNKYLTERDLDIIEEWVVEPGGGDRNVVPELMEHWAAAKSENLFKLFGDKLIHEKEVVFELPAHEIENEYREIRTKYWYIFQTLDDKLKEQNLFLTEKTIREPWYYDYNLNIEEPQIYFSWRSLTYILSPEVLATNKINCEICVFKDSSNVSHNIHGYDPKAIYTRFSMGGKIGRFLTFIVNLLELTPDEQEYFNTKISELCIDLSRKKQVNQFTGTLCISIHPMDYFTMSDNNYNWYSCMSWVEDGEYKAGTLEMCNSKCVVVAYIKGSSPYVNWNSKRWRELFVVTKDMILGIKGYPFHSNVLEDWTIEMLRELAEKNCGWTYHNTEPFRCGAGLIRLLPVTADSDIRFNWTIHFNKMYNDCYGNNHPVLLGSKVKNGDFIDLEPSGQAYCIYSGKEIPNDCPESLLIHPEYSRFTKCPHCGYWYDADCDGGYAEKWGVDVCDACLDEYWQEIENSDDED